MRNRILFLLALFGILGGLVSAYFFGNQQKPKPPAFKPASNPYEKGIYANGIIESDQQSGENINIYPEVSGSVTKVMVSEGQEVKKGQPLFAIDRDVQQAAVEEQRAQADSAQMQISLALANLKSLDDQYAKLRHSYELDPKSVSRDALDNAENSVEVGKASLDLAKKQYAAAVKTYQASKVLLSKYVVTAPSAGRILAIDTAVGSYLSPQGSYDTYTGGFGPALVMGNAGPHVAVRCYVDEILISRLPSPSKMHARMFVRGTEISIPLEYVRAQPYVSPKIELSNQRTERVDVRVLPIIFRFEAPKNLKLYPGQLVDVYIGERQ